MVTKNVKAPETKRSKAFRKKAKELVKGGRSGRRVYGGIYELSNKTRVYVAYRYRGEIYRSGERNVSAAADKGLAAWAIDDSTIRWLKRHVISLVAVYVRDEDEVYIARRDYFEDPARASRIDFSAKRGSMQISLPFGCFVKMSAEDFESKLSS